MLNNQHIKDKQLKLLVPTDFSGTGVNAAAYAIQLFHKKTGELILENVFQAPKEKAGTLISITDILLSESKTLLEKERKHLAAEFRNVNISIESEEGSIINTIKNAIKAKNINLLVLGIPKRAAYLTSVPKTFIELPYYWPMLMVPQSALKNKSKELVIIISEDSRHRNTLELETYLKDINLKDNKMHHIEFTTNNSVVQLMKQLDELLKKHKIGLLVFNTFKGDKLQKAITNHELDSLLLTLPALIMQNNEA